MTKGKRCVGAHQGKEKQGCHIHQETRKKEEIEMKESKQTTKYIDNLHNRAIDCIDRKMYKGARLYYAQAASAEKTYRLMKKGSPDKS